jgi:hypothetical protein
MRRSMIMTVLVFIVAGACSSGSSSMTVKGSVALADSGSSMGGIPEAIGNRCNGVRGFDDIAEGAAVKVTDDKNDLIATSKLTEGRETGASCTFSFAVDVPTGRAFYQFEVSHRGTVSFSADDLKAKGNTISLSVG